MVFPCKQLAGNLKRIMSVAVVTLLLIACNRQTDYVAPPPMEVTVSRPQQQTVTEYAEFTGMIEALESVAIKARVEGYLERIAFQSGARVKKGDLLFVIDPKPFQAKLDEARAELARRQAELKKAETTSQKKELAFKANAVSELEVIQSKAEWDVAKAAMQAAQAAIETAELNLSYTKIHAPISGRISRNLVDAGNLVGAGERTLLATIVNDDPIYAYFNVSERDLLYYEEHQGTSESPIKGDGATLAFLGLSNQPGYPFEGRIDYVDNRLDATTGTIQVRGRFANPDHRLRAGLFARIRVPVATREKALLAPDIAIGKDQRGDYLLAVNDQNIVELRPVETGALINDMRVILSGISPNDRLIVSGLQRARPGLPVKPQETVPSLPVSGNLDPKSN
jgi:RND family efflux transporter MFP subunit